MARNESTSPQGLAGWFAGSGATVENAVPVTGMARPTAARATRTATGSGNVRVSAPEFEPGGLIEGQVYAVTMEGRPSVASWSSVELTFRRANGSSVGAPFSPAVSVPAGTTHAPTVVATAPAEAVRLSVTFLARGMPQGATLDGTACRITRDGGDPLVFADGDTAGWRWLGEPGLSASTDDPPPWTPPAPPEPADALQERTLGELDTWAGWLATTGARGHVGEFGTVTLWDKYGDPGQADQYDALLDTYLLAAESLGVSTTGWASGRNWGEGYPLGVHVGLAIGDPLTIANSAAPVYAAHPSRPEHDQWHGVNLSGAEQGVTIYGGPDVRATAGQPPTAADVAYLAAQGVDHIRLPLAWERLQPTRGGALDAGHLAWLDEVLGACAANGIAVDLDALHNYGRYTDASGDVQVLGAGLSTTDLVHVWTRLSRWLREDPVRDATVHALDLMNEPHDLVGGVATWEAASQAVVEALRADGDVRWLLVEGYTFASLYEWTVWHPAGWITDPLARFAYSAHHYWDSRSVLGARSGTYQQDNGAGGVEILTYATELAGAVEDLEPADADPRTYLGPVDTFDGGLEQWPGAYGATEVAAGRALVGSLAIPAYSGLETQPDGRAFEGRSVHVEVLPADAGTSTVEAMTNVWIGSGSDGGLNGGNRAGWTYNAVTGVLSAQLQTGYSDGGAVDIPYVPERHRWWLVEDTGVVIRWATSATGLDGDWITRRVLAGRPAWVDSPDAVVALESYRGDGAGTRAVFDNVNADPYVPVTVQGAARATATAAGSAGPTRASTAAARGAAASSSSAQVTGALENGSAGAASASGRALVGLRVVPASARATATARAGAELRPSGEASATGPVTAAGSSSATRVSPAAGSGSASSTASADPLRVRPAAAGSSSTAAGTARAVLVGRPGARARVAGRAWAGVLGAWRETARSTARALARVLARPVAPSGAAERAGSIGGALPGPVAPAGAREDATSDARAHADPIGTDPSGSSASSAGSARWRRVVPLSARGTARAGSAGHTTAAARPTARAQVLVEGAADARAVAPAAASSRSSSTGRARDAGRVVRLRAAAGCSTGSRSRARIVGASSATATAAGSTGSTPQPVVPSSSSAAGSGSGTAAGRMARRYAARDLVGAEGVATAQPLGLTAARAGAQGDGDALSRLVGCPAVHGPATSTGAGSARRVSHARALARAGSTAGASSGAFTARGRALGTARAAGAVVEAVDIPGDLAPTARPAALVATARPNRLEVSVS